MAQLSSISMLLLCAVIIQAAPPGDNAGVYGDLNLDDLLQGSANAGNPIPNTGASSNTGGIPNQGSAYNPGGGLPKYNYNGGMPNQGNPPPNYNYPGGKPPQGGNPPPNYNYPGGKPPQGGNPPPNYNYPGGKPPQGGKAPPNYNYPGGKPPPGGNPYQMPPQPNADKKFHVAKLNLLWEKAKKTVAPGVMVELYGDLVVQDKLEIETKKAVMDGQDETGEQQALTRQKFLDLLKKYKLYDDKDPRMNSMQEFDKNLPTLEGGKKMDRRMAMIWKTAQDLGMTDEELEELKTEFSHHQQKLEEFNQLKNEVDNIAANALDNNLTDGDEYDFEAHKQKKEDMKLKWKQIQDGFMTLEQNVIKNPNRTFNDPKVAALWKVAQTANMTEIELESFKEELKHFETRLEKHDFFRKELAMQGEMMMRDPMAQKDPAGQDRLVKLEQTVQDQAKKIKKIQTELKDRIKGKSEL